MEAIGSAEVHLQEKFATRKIADAAARLEVDLTSQMKRLTASWAKRVGEVPRVRVLLSDGSGAEQICLPYMCHEGYEHLVRTAKTCTDLQLQSTTL